MENLNVRIEEAVRTGNFADIRNTLSFLPPSEIADVLINSPSDAQALMFRCLPRKLAASTFEYLPHEEQRELLKSLADKEVAEILNSMSDDDRTKLLEELPGAVTKKLLELLTAKEREVALKLLGYPKGSVGRLMTPHYIAVNPSWTVRKVLEYVRVNGRDSETLTMVYVIDDQGILIDEIRMRSFLLTPLDKTVADLMDNSFTSLAAADFQEDAVAAFRHADLPALPVTDSDGLLIGIVTSDDILDVAERIATEDAQKFGGLETLDLPYVKTPFLRLIRKRASWLIVLFLGEMLTATAMSYFDGEIEKAVVLALFVPLIISSGGNSGSQAATLIIRAMALKEITLKDWWYVMRREIFSGLTLGVILGIIGFVRIAVWQKLNFFNYTEHWFLVAATIFFSLIGIVMWGTISGSMIPFVLRRLGLDPATSSAPFVATLVDVTGLIIYFTVASIILSGTLL
jgi:magnesium transporter